jgi:RimJ/RimL family protein N-acetyltransferase
MSPVNESDLIEYIELFSDPAVMRFVGIEAGYIPSYKEIEQIHNSAVQAWKTRGYGRWSIFDCKTKEFVGFCGFRSEQGSPELICMLHERFWGKGLAVEAAGACLSYGFESLAFTEVKAFTRPDHSRARRVLDKINAKFTSYVDFHGVEGAAYLIKPDSVEF